jgi:hypothetical protein
MATQDRYPNKQFDQVTQTGLKALELATEHKAALDGRLPAGARDGLAADLDALGADVPAALIKRTVSKVATRSQDDALAEGYALFNAIRLNVTRRKASVAVRHAYGVGTTVNPKIVKRVSAAIAQMVDRAKANPSEAASLGILPADVAELEADLARITSVDAEQEQLRASAPLTTKQRNQTANRILGAVDAIAGAGMMQFAKSATERQRFEALVQASASKRSATKAKKAKAGAVA